MVGHQIKSFLQTISENITEVITESMITESAPTLLAGWVLKPAQIEIESL